MIVAKTINEWLAAPPYQSADSVERLLDDWIAEHPDLKLDRREAAEMILFHVDSWLRLRNHRPSDDG
jgi:hypothetical protein